MLWLRCSKILLTQVKSQNNWITEVPVIRFYGDFYKSDAELQVEAMAMAEGTQHMVLSRNDMRPINCSN
jgi:hypothetical protein